MRLKKGDKFLAEIVEVTDSAAFAEASEWSNVSEIVIDPAVAVTIITPGQQLSVEVDRVKQDTAYASQFRGAYSGHHEPGDTLQAKAGFQHREKVCTGELQEPRNIERLILVGAYPEDTVKATLRKLRDGVGFAIVDEIVEAGLRTGDLIEVRTIEDTRSGRTINGNLDVELDRHAHIQTDVSARITDLTPPIQVTVEDSGHLPTVGRTIDLQIIKDSRRARALTGDYEVELDRYAHVKTTAAGKVTETGPPVEVTIVDSGDLPTEDDLIEARTIENSKRATAINGGYDIKLNRYAHLSTQVTAKVTAIGGPVKATIEDPGELPSAGREIAAVTIPNTNKAVATVGDFEVLVDRDLPVEADVLVEVTRVSDEDVFGEIIDDGYLPEKGNVVRARVRRGETQAKAIELGYDVTLESPALGSGEVDIKFTKITEYTPKAEIQSYRDTIPQPGKQVRAFISSNNREASPREYDCAISLQGDVPKSGYGAVKTIKIADEVVGEVVGYKSQTGDEVDPVGRMNQTLNNTNL
ncbi:hypothetical protein [Halobacterium salinarum]|uniref:hypothetical protein n=1 Tax=Halobacterium salinarum TaxID=2242 RepID=UPI002553D4E2|nr:hypothetical protein [Halobacterium salinarum]MDL0141678.1 hypothetical protein [Halobacterium salinarum]